MLTVFIILIYTCPFFILLDCLSTTCSEPYTNSPPGAPCICVLPMKVGLRLSVSLYTFFPLVSELASEIATGVFMSQSQVRIMGAEAASQDPDKTDALIFLVPLGEEFDNTSAFLTSERFWHKQVVIKASYFGNYEVLYVSYPGIYKFSIPCILFMTLLVRNFMGSSIYRFTAISSYTTFKHFHDRWWSIFK